MQTYDYASAHETAMKNMGECISCIHHKIYNYAMRGTEKTAYIFYGTYCVAMCKNLRHQQVDATNYFTVSLHNPYESHLDVIRVVHKGMSVFLEILRKRGNSHRLHEPHDALHIAQITLQMRIPAIYI